MKNIAWPKQYTGIGSAFGYTTFAKGFARELLSRGIEFTDESNVTMHMMPPFFFYGWRFKTDVLFTMFEFEPIPSQWYSHIDKADILIVPCSDNKRLFEQATKKPIEICPGGVDSERFYFVEREKTDPFTFLFVGDDNPRKGTGHVAMAWELWNERYPELSDKTRLIMKMTSYFKPPEFKQITKNAYIDYRVLPGAETEGDDLPPIASIYAAANCFLWPTMGEGWGLPLCEAMSSGLPCIYTPYGGTNDTATEDYAYPVEYEMQPTVIMNPRGGKLDTVEGASPIIESVVDRMHEIYTNYDDALEKGRIAAMVMRKFFTWERAANTLIEILDRRCA